MGQLLLELPGVRFDLIGPSLAPEGEEDQQGANGIHHTFEPGHSAIAPKTVITAPLCAAG